MIILGTNSIKETGFDVANSLRFNSGSSDYLTRTPSSATNKDLWTLSLWVKRSRVGTGGTQSLYGVSPDGNNQETLAFDSGGNVDKLYWQLYQGGSVVGQLTTNRVFRDVSAWYHIVIAYDSANGTAGNRMRMYINGVEETSFATDTNPSSGQDSLWNSTTAHTIGRIITTNYFDGYIAEVNSVDGQALDATSFGEFDDSGIWKPIDVSGLTLGTNGFYLDFEDSSALGNDAAGSNNFTVENLTTIDQSTDTCTNNFATFNPLDKTGTGAPTGSEGNLKLTGDASTNNTWNSTIGLSAGKWYVEMKVLQSSPDVSLGFRSQTNTSGSHNNIYGFDCNPDRKKINGSNSGSAIGSTSQNDILGMALDLDNGKMFIHRNGTYLSSGDPANGTNPFIVTADGMPTEGVIGGHIYNGAVEWNFGSPPYAISSGNTDGNGYGNFEYAVPSGYYSLNTKNLSEFG